MVKIGYRKEAKAYVNQICGDEKILLNQVTIEGGYTKIIVNQR